MKTSHKMEANNIQQERYFKAQKKVKGIRGFYTHLLIYCLVIPTIIYTNLTFEPNFHWFCFSALGWGTGLFFHWMSIFGFNLLGIGKDWEEKKIKEYMNQNK
jgi:hypothetical protein